MQDTYSVKELMKRYKCARSTIFNMMNTKGFPRGGCTTQRASSISWDEIRPWEEKHMPWLHPRPKSEDEKDRQEDDEKWNGPDGILAKRDAVLKEAQKKIDPVPKAERSWKKVQNAEKKKLAAIRSRHGR